MLANLNWEGTNMTYDALQLQVPPTGTDTFLFPVVKQELNLARADILGPTRSCCDPWIEEIIIKKPSKIYIFYKISP